MLPLAGLETAIVIFSQRNAATKRKLQFNITFILAVTAMVGMTLAVLRHFNAYLALPALAIPFAIAVEVLTTGAGTPEGISYLSQLRRLSMVVLMSALLAGLSFWSISAGYPTVVTPLPFLSVILAMFAFPLTLIVGVPAIAFIATVAPNVWFQREGLPVRFHFLLIVSTIATVYWLITGWDYANEYQSHGYAVGVTAVNIVALCVLWVAVWMLRNSRSFWQTLAFATALFAWLFAFAFPWMGELP